LSKREGNLTEDILGCAVSTQSANDCISELANWISNGEKGRYFVCANPHSLEVARGDSLFHEALKEAALTIPDGIGIVLASKMLGGSIRERVTGSDIFLGLSSRLNQAGGYRYFFLGSTEDTLGKICEKMGTEFPKIGVAGTYSPPFREEFSDEENKLMLEAINRAGPDVLWVGMTAPKQEKWIYLNRSELNVSLICPVGGVFDYFAGTVKRAHPFFQKIGLEWFPRMLRNPRRLWRRNFISNPSFLKRVAVSLMASDKTVVARDRESEGLMEKFYER
jgi:N-acetylglucosaminyldiphosphoundecaprenol N-acetyl-beta-D-mannosaminyltransferase